MTSIRRAFRFASIALAVVALAAFPIQTLAASWSTHGTFPVVDQFVDPGASGACGFPVTADLEGLGRFEVHLDAAGNATDIAIHISRTGTLSGNGVTLSEFDRINVFIDLRSGSQREVGIEFRVSPPGGNPVIFDRGRLVFDTDGNVTFVAGPHPALDGDFAGLCEALGG